MEPDKNSVEICDQPSIGKPDSSELCRLCANTDNQLIPIFRGEGLEHNVSSKIEKHLPIIKVTESDKLPLQICYQCASTLIAWHNLYEGCKTADQRLREILATDEKLCQDEDVYEDFGDDFREYEDQPQNYVESTRINCVIDSKVDSQNTSDAEVNPICDSEVFQETENSVTDARCLRWTYKNEDVVEDSSANIPGTSSRANDDLVDAFLIRPAEIASVVDKKCLINVCDCVWNSGDDCLMCARYDSFKCAYCPMVFVEARARNRHLRTSHKSQLLDRCLDWLYRNSICQSGGGCSSTTVRNPADERGRYECNECFAVLQDKVGLIGHLRTHEVVRGAQSGDDRQSPAVQKSRIAGRRFDCEYCAEKSFAAEKTLEQHLAECHSSVIRNDQRVRTSTGSGDDNDSQPKTNYYVCDACGLIFLKRYSFTRHWNLHTSKRYECDKCRKTFTSVGGLTVHRASAHKELPKNVLVVDGRKYLKCDRCSFTCRNERNKLEEHVRVHTGEKPFTCEQCGKQFRTKSLLRVHRRFVHEGVKEHACDICGRRFSNRRYVDEHRRIHTGEKPLVCDLCGKAFRQSSSLFKHLEHHSGIKKHSCHLCDKRFSNSHHLSIHIKRHMGEASHVCGRCGKGFVDQYQLKNHNVVHSDERPFACGLCGTRFKLRKHLKQHGKTHKSG